MNFYCEKEKTFITLNKEELEKRIKINSNNNHGSINYRLIPMDEESINATISLENIKTDNKNNEDTLIDEMAKLYGLTEKKLIKIAAAINVKENTSEPGDPLYIDINNVRLFKPTQRTACHTKLINLTDLDKLANSPKKVIGKENADFFTLYTDPFIIDLDMSAETTQDIFARPDVEKTLISILALGAINTSPDIHNDSTTGEVLSSMELLSNMNNAHKLEVLAEQHSIANKLANDSDYYIQYSSKIIGKRNDYDHPLVINDDSSEYNRAQLFGNVCHNYIDTHNQSAKLIKIDSNALIELGATSDTIHCLIVDKTGKPIRETKLEKGKIYELNNLKEIENIQAYTKVKEPKQDIDWDMPY